MTSNRMSTVVAGAAIISIGTLISRLLGLVRENLLVNTFPERWMTDAYLSAFLVPDTVYYLLAGGALSAAFIPVFSGYLAKDRQEDALRIANSVMNLMLMAVAVGVVLIFIFAPAVVRVVANGYEPGSPVFNLTVILAREMCVMVFFTAMSGLLTGILNSYHHFLTPVIVWNTYNLGIIFGIKYLSHLPLRGDLPAFLHWNGDTLGIHGAALGVLIGSITLVLVQLPVVMKYGYRYRAVLDLGHEGVRKVLMLFAPVMIGLALTQVNLLVVPQALGSHLPEGAVTDIRAANRLVLLPLGLFAIAVSTAAFPKLAQQVAVGLKDEFRDTVSRLLKVILLLAMPSAMALFLLAEPMIAFLLGGEHYGLTDIRAAAFALALFSWGLLGISAIQLINRAYYSLHDTVTPVLVSVGVVAANVAFAWYLIHIESLQYGGVALSTAVTSTLGTLLLFEMLRRRLGGIGGRSILVTTGKLFAASVVMGAVMFLVATALAPTGTAGATPVQFAPVFPFRWPAPDLLARVAQGVEFSRMALGVQIGLSCTAGMAVYFGMLWALRVEEMHVITARLRARFRKAPSTV